MVYRIQVYQESNRLVIYLVYPYLCGTQIDHPMPSHEKSATETNTPFTNILLQLEIR